MTPAIIGDGKNICQAPSSVMSRVKLLESATTLTSSEVVAGSINTPSTSVSMYNKENVVHYGSVSKDVTREREIELQRYGIDGNVGEIHKISNASKVSQDSHFRTTSMHRSHVQKPNKNATSAAAARNARAARIRRSHDEVEKVTRNVETQLKQLLTRSLEVAAQKYEGGREGSISDSSIAKVPQRGAQDFDIVNNTALEDLPTEKNTKPGDDDESAWNWRDKLKHQKRQIQDLSLDHQNRNSNGKQLNSNTESRFSTQSLRSSQAQQNHLSPGKDSVITSFTSHEEKGPGMILNTSLPNYSYKHDKPNGRQISSTNDNIEQLEKVKQKYGSPKYQNGTHSFNPNHFIKSTFASDCSSETNKKSHASTIFVNNSARNTPIRTSKFNSSHKVTSQPSSKLYTDSPEKDTVISSFTSHEEAGPGFIRNYNNICSKPLTKRPIVNVEEKCVPTSRQFSSGNKAIEPNMEYRDSPEKDTVISSFTSHEEAGPGFIRNFNRSKYEGKPQNTKAIVRSAQFKYSKRVATYEVEHRDSPDKDTVVSSFTSHDEAGPGLIRNSSSNKVESRKQMKNTTDYINGERCQNDALMNNMITTGVESKDSPGKDTIISTLTSHEEAGPGVIRRNTCSFLDKTVANITSNSYNLKKTELSSYKKYQIGSHAVLDKHSPGKDSVVTSFTSHEEAGPGLIRNFNSSKCASKHQIIRHIDGRKDSIPNTNLLTPMDAFTTPKMEYKNSPEKDTVVSSFTSHEEAGPGFIRNLNSSQDESLSQNNSVSRDLSAMDSALASINGYKDSPEKDTVISSFTSHEEAGPGLIRNLNSSQVESQSQNNSISRDLSAMINALPSINSYKDSPEKDTVISSFTSHEEAGPGFIRNVAPSDCDRAVRDPTHKSVAANINNDSNTFHSENYNTNTHQKDTGAGMMQNVCINEADLKIQHINLMERQSESSDSNKSVNEELTSIENSHTETKDAVVSSFHSREDPESNGDQSVDLGKISNTPAEMMKEKSKLLLDLANVSKRNDSYDDEQEQSQKLNCSNIHGHSHDSFDIGSVSPGKDTVVSSFTSHDEAGPGMIINNVNIDLHSKASFGIDHCESSGEEKYVNNISLNQGHSQIDSNKEQSISCESDLSSENKISINEYESPFQALPDKLPENENWLHGEQIANDIEVNEDDCQTCESNHCHSPHPKDTNISGFTSHEEGSESTTHSFYQQDTIKHLQSCEESETTEISINTSSHDFSQLDNSSSEESFCDETGEHKSESTTLSTHEELPSILSEVNLNHHSIHEDDNSAKANSTNGNAQDRQRGKVAVTNQVNDSEAIPSSPTGQFSSYLDTVKDILKDRTMNSTSIEHNSSSRSGKSDSSKESMKHVSEFNVEVNDQHISREYSIYQEDKPTLQEMNLCEKTSSCDEDNHERSMDIRVSISAETCKMGNRKTNDIGKMKMSSKLPAYSKKKLSSREKGDRIKPFIIKGGQGSSLTGREVGNKSSPLVEEGIYNLNPCDDSESNSIVKESNHSDFSNPAFGKLQGFRSLALSKYTSNPWPNEIDDSSFKQAFDHSTLKVASDSTKYSSSQLNELEDSDLFGSSFQQETSRNSKERREIPSLPCQMASSESTKVDAFMDLTYMDQHDSKPVSFNSSYSPSEEISIGSNSNDEFQMTQHFCDSNYDLFPDDIKKDMLIKSGFQETEKSLTEDDSTMEPVEPISCQPSINNLELTAFSNAAVSFFEEQQSELKSLSYCQDRPSIDNVIDEAAKSDIEAKSNHSELSSQSSRSLQDRTSYVRDKDEDEYLNEADNFNMVGETCDPSASGSEALSIWWQNTYASTQDPEINAQVLQALSAQGNGKSASEALRLNEVVGVGDSISNFSAKSSSHNNRHDLNTCSGESDDEEDVFSGIENEDYLQEYDCSVNEKTTESCQKDAVSTQVSSETSSTLDGNTLDYSAYNDNSIHTNDNETVDTSRTSVLHANTLDYSAYNENSIHTNDNGTVDTSRESQPDQVGYSSFSRQSAENSKIEDVEGVANKFETSNMAEFKEQMPACFDLLTEDGTVSTINTGPNTEKKTPILKKALTNQESKRENEEYTNSNEINSLEDASGNDEEYETDEYNDEEDETSSNEYEDSSTGTTELKVDDDQSLVTSVDGHSIWTNDIIGNLMHGLEARNLSGSQQKEIPYGCGILAPLLLCDGNHSKDKMFDSQEMDSSATEDDRKDDSPDDSPNTESRDLVSTANVDLSEKERQVWEDWDRKDVSMVDQASSQIGDNKEVTINAELQERQRLAQYLDRRSRAHEKLLLHAYCALSQFTIKGSNVDEVDQNEIEVIEREENHCVSNNNPPLVEGDIGMNSVDDQMPLNDLEGDMSSTRNRFLGHFVSKLKTKSVEVLKLNRENKWQSRFLTFTKEIRSNKPNEDANDEMKCPEGILWLKKFQNKKEYSIKIIDKDGKGGIDLAQLTSVELLLDMKSLARVPKKLKQVKYKKSAAVMLHCLDDITKVHRKIVFLSQSKTEAEFLCAGFTIIKEMVGTSNQNDEDKKVKENEDVPNPASCEQPTIQKSNTEQSVVEVDDSKVHSMHKIQSECSSKQFCEI